MKDILKYFPDLTAQQIEKLAALYDIYAFWNEKINVISRKDFTYFYERHVLHSLSIAKFFSFSTQTQIMDVGTGGGFPGIPLAIFFPHCEFLLVDSIAKKIKVVNEVIENIKLTNVQTANCRVENIEPKFDFITARAVTDLKLFTNLVKKNLSSNNRNENPNGIIYLKGMENENKQNFFGWNYKIFPISLVFSEPFFETKSIVYLHK